MKMKGSSNYGSLRKWYVGDGEEALTVVRDKGSINIIYGMITFLNYLVMHSFRVLHLLAFFCIFFF